LDLNQLGWNSLFASRFDLIKDGDLVPGRVIAAHRELSVVLCSHGELRAEVSGRFRREAEGRGDFPVVGDWVALTPRPRESNATIHAILPRSSAIARRAAGAGQHARTEGQVVAANVDTALIVMGLDGDFNLRRLERYLTVAWGAGVQPVIVLNKADLCDNLPGRIAETEAAAVGVPVLSVSAETGQGVEGLLPFLKTGCTAALLGSSGVGKSTLVNRLLGEHCMETRPLREDDSRGRHTTTHREMLILPGGGLLIDNPGMREVGLWGTEDDLDGAFSDLEALARECRFSDCSHAGEPGCAVRAALERGVIDEARYRSWQKLQRELAFLSSRDDVRMRLEKEKALKNISLLQKRFRKDRRA
jgi:ribosome biogenesis GTPase / thiamine phosphate phosphatase